MSLCVSFFLNGNIHVYSDSRVSAYEDGVSYFVHDDYVKARQVGDKVIFTSGELDICEMLYAAIDERSTIEDIAAAARKSYTAFKLANPHYDGGKFGVEFGVYVHAIEKGKPVYYQLRYNDDFKIDRQVPNNQELFAVAGRSEEALAIIEKLTQRGIPVDRAIVRAYERLANETIGGNLTRYTLSASGIERLVRPIRESKPLRKWYERDAVLHADMQGNVIARKITLTGTVENSDIKSGTITGALIRTAASGARVEMDYRGWRTYDANGRERISINSNDTYGMSAISFARSSGSAAGYINGGDSIFQMTSSGDMMFAALSGRVYFQGTTQFRSSVQFDSGVTGINITHVDGLSSRLSTIDSKLSNMPSLSQIATNMSFDSSTRNLKLYSATGATLATVNIPK